MDRRNVRAPDPAGHRFDWSCGSQCARPLDATAPELTTRVADASVGWSSVIPMYCTVAISGYRSLRDVLLPLGRLTVVTGPNGAGKSSIYRGLRLLAACSRGEVVGALAREGGLNSALWAGPESLAGARRGHQVQGTMRKGPVSVKLGVGGAGTDPGYLVDLGIPVQSQHTMFNRDPEIKREAVWRGPVMRRTTLSARRKHGEVHLREVDDWAPAPVRLPAWTSMLEELVDPVASPDLWQVRRELGSWRFYDGFRVDEHSPARRPQVGTRTRVLSDDGSDLTAALATIGESGHVDLDRAVADAFEGSRLGFGDVAGFLDLQLRQAGMLRPLRAPELSDGTLRYLLWLAALHSPQPPALMALNEPETSLHPSLVPPLARAIVEASGRTQVVVVTHSRALLDAMVHEIGQEADPGGEVPPLQVVELVKDLGETLVQDQGLLTRPTWEWGRR